MEKENVLEIEFQPVFDKWAWRVTKNTLYELELKIQKGVGNYTIINLNDDDNDNYDDDYIINTNNLINEQIKNKLENFVKQINEKYGIKKRWRGKYNEIYCYIDEFFEIKTVYERGIEKDNERYKVGNYFEIGKEALEYAEYMKKKSLEWHEKRDNND